MEAATSGEDDPATSFNTSVDSDAKKDQVADGKTFVGSEAEKDAEKSVPERLEDMERTLQEHKKQLNKQLEEQLNKQRKDFEQKLRQMQEQLNGQKRLSDEKLEFAGMKGEERELEQKQSELSFEERFEERVEKLERAMMKTENAPESLDIEEALAIDENALVEANETFALFQEHLDGNEFKDPRSGFWKKKETDSSKHFESPFTSKIVPERGTRSVNLARKSIARHSSSKTRSFASSVKSARKSILDTGKSMLDTVHKTIGYTGSTTQSPFEEMYRSREQTLKEIFSADSSFYDTSSNKSLGMPSENTNSWVNAIEKKKEEVLSEKKPNGIFWTLLLTRIAVTEVTVARLLLDFIERNRPKSLEEQIKESAKKAAEEAAVDAAEVAIDNSLSKTILKGDDTGSQVARASTAGFLTVLGQSIMGIFR